MISIKRAKPDDHWLDEPLTWQAIGTPSGRSAAVSCSNSHRGTLEDHQIGVDGAVTPSLVCSECDWHEFVRLMGWIA